MMLTQAAYLPPMLKLKTVLNLKKTLKRMIHLMFEKKKHLTRARSILEKTSLQVRHGKKREPWVHKSMPFPSKFVKTKEEEHYNKFCEWMNLFFFIFL